jgi:hypothetical protein
LDKALTELLEQQPAVVGVVEVQMVQLLLLAVQVLGVLMVVVVAVLEAPVHPGVMAQAALFVLSGVSLDRSHQQILATYECAGFGYCL